MKAEKDALARDAALSFVVVVALFAALSALMTVFLAFPILTVGVVLFLAGWISTFLLTREWRGRNRNCRDLI